MVFVRVVLQVVLSAMDLANAIHVTQGNLTLFKAKPSVYVSQGVLTDGSDVKFMALQKI